MKMNRSIRKRVFGLVLGVLILTGSVLSLSTASAAQIGIGISVRIGPPALPIYAQPICPGPGYLWTPGYWAWNDPGGYYWVPGTWVVAPVGMLWTPGYWGFAGGFYGWHAGYWGPHVGFYGGINYGFGYGGVGFGGGEWRGGAFFYNRAVMNVNVTNIRNVYSRTVVVNNVHTSFNGPGGIEARPTAEEERFAHEQHTPALAAQTEHEHAASQNRASFASENHGRPAIAATARPGEFSGRDATRASGGERGVNDREPARTGGNDRAGNDRAGNDRANDRAVARPENHDARSGEARNNEAGRASSRQNAKPSRQEKQAQKKAQKQAKADQKRNER
ncbi:MAG: hypothetical protein ABSB87_14745 [Terriglobales bacterium]|jgi:hypothetical protein